MQTLLPYLFIGGVFVALLAWSWHFHFWSNSPAARRSRSPLWLGFSTTAASALFLVAGIIGFNLDRRARFFAGTPWTNRVIWWEVAVGVVLVPIAIYLLRLGARDIDRRLTGIR